MTTINTPTDDEDPSTLKGLALAVAIIGGWLAAHIYSVFFFQFTLESWPWAVGLVLINTWLSVGLFIVAHDCMHGSLVPFHPSINRAVGRICLILYAGFSFDELNRKHHLHHRHAGTHDDPDFHVHHRHAGTHDDPDFHDRPPYGYWRWFGNFLAEYFSWRQFAHMTVRILVYVLVLGASVENALLLWWVPALLSALQLFTFGTYLPHRPERLPFSDRHRTRSNEYSWLLSLLTCFHFGYHHEHHLEPNVPWWRLPQARRRHARAKPHAG